MRCSLSLGCVVDESMHILLQKIRSKRIPGLNYGPIQMNIGTVEAC